MISILRGNPESGYGGQRFFEQSIVAPGLALPGLVRTRSGEDPAAILKWRYRDQPTGFGPSSL
jgi:hypothetical protein